MTTQEDDIRTGHCLCNAVTFSATLPRTTMQLCHCQQCQRWTGGGPLTGIRVKNLELTGEATIQTYHASEHGERAFCKTCGTTLYWKLQGRGIAFLPVGLFDDQSGLEVTEEIFVDHRPDWLPAWSGAQQHTEAEMNAQLQAYLDKQSS